MFRDFKTAVIAFLKLLKHVLNTNPNFFSKRFDEIFLNSPNFLQFT